VARIKVGKGRCEVTIDGALASSLETELREALGPVGTTMQSAADGILKDARADWPVKSGKSKASLADSLRVHPDSFQVEVVLYSPLSYVRYIKSTKVGSKDESVRDRSPFQDLLRKPAREAEKTLAKTLPGVVGKALTGG